MNPNNTTPNPLFAKFDQALGKTTPTNTSGFVSRADQIRALAKTATTETQTKGETGLKGFATGVGKGILSTVKGAGQLGESIGQGVLGGVEKLTGLPVTSPSVYSEEALQKGKEKGEIMGTLLNKENIEPKTTSEKLGKFTEQVAEFAIPASKVSKLTKGASMVGKIVPRALTSGTVASIQSGKVGKEAGIAAGIETALPVVGKVIVQPAKKIVGRLIKGLSSGLSGVGTDTIDKILQNPKAASETVKNLTKGGNSEILKKNAETIINGVSQIKREARQAFGTGLEALKATDIDDKVFRTSTQTVLDKFGSVLKNGKRELSNVEFSDPKNIKTANELLNKLSTTKLDGKSLRKLADDIESKAFKIATSDERLSFNVFIKDLANSLKNGISKSTSKLNEINKSFSTDMELAQSIENIFGKVKFKNASEINKVSQQLESLFSKKGLSSEYLDKFLTRIGIKPEQFTTSEAVRQISNKTTGANTKGLSIGEIVQQVTGSVITPKLVRDIAIKTGKSEIVIKKLIENTAPSARAALIKSLIPSKE
jgi:hypothetical protein